MWNDTEIDMEELEARLYGQVHHPTGDDVEYSITGLLIPSQVSLRPANRYFVNKSPVSTTTTIARVPVTVQTTQVFIPIKNPIPSLLDIQLPPANVIFNNNCNVLYEQDDSENFNHVQSVAKRSTELVLNPLPSREIISPLALSYSETIKEKKRLRNRNKRRARRIRMKEKVGKMFKEHFLTPSFGYLETPPEEVICLSESDNSDCEIAIPPVEEILVSSDEESHFARFSIKDENVTNKSAPINERKDDGNIVLTEPEEKQIVVIDCDDPCTSGIERELLDTPESTNDFLDVTLTRSNLDEVLSLEKEQVHRELSESESSEVEVEHSKNGIFIEREFEGPSLNLDTFASYIGSGTNACGVRSILTPVRYLSYDIGDNTSKQKTSQINNSSDSSSESDYDDTKTKLVKNKSDGNNSSTSESDYCIINDSSTNLLPNLSPITSDEDTKKRIESPKVRKKKLNFEEDKVVPARKPKKENNRSIAEKRKLITGKEKGVKKKKSNGSEFFSTSDEEFSEIEIGRGDFDAKIELINIKNTSTPVKKSIESPTKSRFSDYWTDDMRKFYFDSWGHEEFSVVSEQSKMSDDPKMWTIIEKDRIHMKVIPKGPRCHRCREFGHKGMNCRKKLSMPKCSLCGGAGHFDARCPNKICTSCGRKNNLFTTCCAGCANSQNLFCVICSMRGHMSLYCSDNWRRYHLTTTDGPLTYPDDISLKSRQDRWCSGCASRGHFEYSCNYYNRTHPPVHLIVYDYTDIYGPKDCSGQCIVYPEWYGNDESFFHRFPLYQAIQNPPVTHQNVNNIFLPSMAACSSCDKKQKRSYLKLKGTAAKQLLTGAGVDFLKELNIKTGTKVQVMKRKKQKKVNYLCILQGSDDSMANVKKRIADYCVANNEPRHFHLKKIFKGKPFDLQVLCETLTRIDEIPNNALWVPNIRSLYNKIKRLEAQITKTDNLNKKGDLNRALHNQYVSLNAALLGKIHIEDGAGRMKVLRFSKNEKLLKDSYDYVFRNGSTLKNVNYENLILNLPTVTGLQQNLEKSLRLTSEICKNTKLNKDNVKLRALYDNVLATKYAKLPVWRFKQLCERIKCKQILLKAKYS